MQRSLIQSIQHGDRVVVRRAFLQARALWARILKNKERRRDHVMQLIVDSYHEAQKTKRRARRSSYVRRALARQRDKLARAIGDRMQEDAWARDAFLLRDDKRRRRLVELGQALQVAAARFDLPSVGKVAADLVPQVTAPSRPGPLVRLSLLTPKAIDEVSWAAATRDVDELKTDPQASQGRQATGRSGKQQSPKSGKPATEVSKSKTKSKGDLRLGSGVFAHQVMPWAELVRRAKRSRSHVSALVTRYGIPRVFPAKGKRPFGILRKDAEEHFGIET